MPLQAGLKCQIHSTRAGCGQRDDELRLRATAIIRADGELRTIKPATVLPMARRQFLF